MCQMPAERRSRSTGANEPKPRTLVELNALILAAPAGVKGSARAVLGEGPIGALAGRALPIGRCRGPTEFDGEPGYITVHPSYLLRLRGHDVRTQGFDAFVADLRKANDLAQTRSRGFPGARNPRRGSPGG